MSNYPTIIGRFEHVDLIDNLKCVPVKIDTGAYGSAIHASNITIVQENGKSILKCSLLGHPVYLDTLDFQTEHFTKRRVKSSSGHSALRFQVELKIHLGHNTFVTPFTLTDRSSNVFPVLIGRKVLAKRYIVDVSKTGIKKPELKQAADTVSEDPQFLEGVSA
jgi:hypothetical protein